MSERRRQRITVQPREILPTEPGGIEDAPNDGSKYVRQSGAWALSPTLLPSWGTIVGTLSNQTDLQAALDAAGGGTWEIGTSYYDGTTALYVVYGEDGDWQAIRATSSGTLSTAPAQTGTKPSTLSDLRGLTYS